MSAAPVSDTSLPRAEKQRQRILAAARHCFAEHGFHAASMATIADTAEMSQGLIYRYFENKNAIIIAIIEESLHRKSEHFKDLSEKRQLATKLLAVFQRWQRGDQEVMDPVLFLEMNAQAGRDAQVGQAMLASDRASFAMLKEWLEPLATDAGLQLTQASLDSRVMALQCLIEGLVVRVARDRHTDLDKLAEGVSLMVDAIQRVQRTN